MTAKTGRQCFTGAQVSKSSLPPAIYRVSFWVRKSGLAGGAVTINGTNIPVTADNWSYQEYVSPGVITSVTVNGGAVLIDELRLHPVNSLMNTICYDLAGNVTHLTDSNGNVSSFSFDAFNRLLTIKDNNEHILKTFKYQFANP
jgi:YD repeat-containing protein